jgi:hypothetical protein
MKLFLFAVMIAGMSLTSNLASAGCCSGCAPKALNGNVAVVDKATAALLKREEFRGAEAFAAKLEQIRRNPNAASRAEAYLALVDVQGKEQISAFIGSTPEQRGRYVDALRKSADLSEGQATVAVQSIVDAFFGASGR